MHLCRIMQHFTGVLWVNQQQRMLCTAGTHGVSVFKVSKRNISEGPSLRLRLFMCEGARLFVCLLLIPAILFSKALACHCAVSRCWLPHFTGGDSHIGVLHYVTSAPHICLASGPAVASSSRHVWFGLQICHDGLTALQQ